MLEKSKQMEETMKQYNGKMERMANQKAEIQQNVKRLQMLTQDYQHMLKVQEDIKLTQGRIDRKFEEVQLARQEL